jgi:Methyltransferase domain
MITEEVVHGWWKEKDFRHPGMTNSRIADWIRVLSPWRDKIFDILEIGSFEGRSAIFWMEFFPYAHLTCVDWFRGSIEHDNDTYKPMLSGLEDRFDANTAAYKDRITKMSMSSSEGLPILLEQQHSFDLIYIDGSHEIPDVQQDTIACWKMLRPKGIVIWDDYDTFNPSIRPLIDAFLAEHGDELNVLHRLCVNEAYPDDPNPNCQQLYAVRTR